MENAKIATIFTLILILVLGMYGYWLLSGSDATLKGGFITLATYLVKKIADQVDDIIDKLWGINHTEQPKQEVKA